jgi:hypothetical protein
MLRAFVSCEGWGFRLSTIVRENDPPFAWTGGPPPRFVVVHFLHLPHLDPVLDRVSLYSYHRTFGAPGCSKPCLLSGGNL